MKPIYTYWPVLHAWPITKGRRALIYSINNPNHEERQVMTSTVISYDKESGQIETQNTIYQLAKD